MSTWKITKGIVLAQFIWVTIVGIVLMMIALFATSGKKSKTKDGFQSQDMQKVYDHYKNKNENKKTSVSHSE